MSVERRYSKRYPISGEVYIRYRKQRAFPARAGNCSLNGMLLRTNSLTLLSGALVELDVFLNGHHWQVMGIVTHTQQNGLGVMFYQSQRELYESVVASASIRPRDMGIGDKGPQDMPFVEEMPQ